MAAIDKEINISSRDATWLRPGRVDDNRITIGAKLKIMTCPQSNAGFVIGTERIDKMGGGNTRIKSQYQCRNNYNRDGA